MRRSEWQDRCKRHPEHRLTNGVCPYCLRDRLAHLSAPSSSVTTTTLASTSATSSPYSAGSPPLHHEVLSADTSSVHLAGAGSSFVNVSSFSQPLMPTTSSTVMKPAARKQGDELNSTKGKQEELKKKKKSSNKKNIGRFLSRLVRTEKRRQAGKDDGGGELFHSNTMREKTSTKWLFF